MTLDIHRVCAQLRDVKPSIRTKMPKRLSLQKNYLSILRKKLHWAICKADICAGQKSLEAFSKDFLAIDLLGHFLVTKTAGDLYKNPYFRIYEGAIMTFVKMIEEKHMGKKH